MDDVVARAVASAPSAPIPATTRELDRDIWRMAWPAILSLLLNNVLELIDVAFVGRLGRTPTAAYGYSAQYLHLVGMLIQAVGIGCVALMARAIGARDTVTARRVLASAMVVASAVAAVSVVIVWSFDGVLIGWLGATPDVMDQALPYFRISVLSMLAYSVSFTFESGLRVHRLTRVPMGITLVIVGVKATSTYALVFGQVGCPALGLVGAAWGTVMAHAAGAVLYSLAARRTERAGRAMTFGGDELRAVRETSRAVLGVSLPAMGERFVMSLALLVYYALLSDYGTAAVAAYAIGVRLMAFSWIPGLGFSAAASTFVGQALGAGDASGARHAGRRSIRMAVLVMTVLGVLCLVAREPLARLFTHDEAVIAELVPFMMMLAVSQPFMGAHFTLGGVLRGAGDTMSPLIGAAVGNWGFRVPLSYVFAKVLSLSLPWVWSVLVCDHVARTFYTGWVFLRGNWSTRLGSPAGR